MDAGYFYKNRAILVVIAFNVIIVQELGSDSGLDGPKHWTDFYCTIITLNAIITSIARFLYCRNNLHPLDSVIQDTLVRNIVEVFTLKNLSLIYPRRPPCQIWRLLSLLDIYPSDLYIISSFEKCPNEKMSVKSRIKKNYCIFAKIFSANFRI